MSARLTLDVQQRLVELLASHFVPFAVQITRRDEAHRMVYSSLVVESGDEWFLITAAHCIQELEALFAEGWSYQASWLLDGLAPKRRDEKVIPFDWSAAQYSCSKDIDVGFVKISNYYKETLSANGVVPFKSENFKVPESSALGFCLLGSPLELMDSSLSMRMLTSIVLIPVDRLDERPPEMNHTRVERWYAKIEMPDGLEDIRGMSGGAIIAFRAGSDGILEYWPVAIQSAWMQSTVNIAACPVRDLDGLIATCFE
ncbi:hypothetical protein [Achromobacter dolens]|uniref:hypothetical protein n=1 Tax=Achromobacter dolens TaxID=1287738 RepID=UPI00119F1FBD|nr:hypothetical protein [Achromobacter dolens]